MASILSVLSGNNPNVDDDLEWSARDAASKRRLQEFTRPPAAIVTPPPPPNPLDTPEAANRFSDAAWNAIFGTPLDNFYTPPAVPTNVPDGTKIEPSGSGEFLQDFLKPRPEKGLPPERILSPAEKEVQDKAQIKNFLRSPESVNLFAVARQRDNQFILQNKIIQDYDKMSMYQFAKRYGMDTLNDMATLGVGGDEIESWVSSTTSAGLLDSLRDIGAHGVSTAASGFADLGAAGVGMTVGSGSMVGQGLDALSEYFGGPKLTKYTDEAAVNMAQGGRTVSDALVNALQTDDSYKAEAIANYETQADHIDEEIEYQKTLRTDGEMIAELRRFGKNTMHGAARLWENPKHLENLTSQAIGSMATLGPILKGLSLANTGLKATKLGAGTLKFAPFSQFETAVGIQSGASTYSDVAVQIAGMEHKDLMATSPEYRTMIMSGYSPEEAKTSLASRGGATAGRSAFVTGALTSALAPEGFERSIFSPGARKTFTQGIKELPAIMGREFIEETPQSAGEQFATNYALQQHVDDNQRLSENVGETGIQGGFAGLFSGPMIKSPGLALKLTGKVITAPVKLAYNRLAARAERKMAANEAASGVSTENVAQDAQAAAESVPALVEGLRSVAEESETARQVAEQNQAQTEQTQVQTQDELDRLRDIQESRDQDPALALREVLQGRDARGPAPFPELPPAPGEQPSQKYLDYLQAKAAWDAAAPVTPIAPAETAPVDVAPVGLSPEERAQQTEDFIQRVQTSATLQESDFTELPNHLAEKLMDLQGQSDKPITRFDAMTEMSKVVEDQNAPEQDRNSAALFIADIIHQNRDLFKGEFPEFLQNTPRDNPHLKALVNLFRNLKRMEENPRIADALRFAQDELNISDDAQIDPATPQGQQVIRNTVGAATHAPARVNQKVANQILRQADEGKINLTPDQAKNIRAGLAMQAEGQRASGPTTATPASGAAEAPASPAGSRSAPQVKTTSQDFVARQIETEGGNNPHQRSIREHISEIGRAVASGKPKRIKEAIQDLANFAKSHTNKVNALNESIDKADGTNVSYQALSSDGKFYNNKKGVGVNLGNSGSENLARQIHKEATALVNLANHFIGEHPELKIDPLPEPPALKLSEEGSTTTQQATQTPATTSGTDTAGQSEPSSSAASGKAQTPAAELTPEQKKLRDLKPEELTRRLEFFERQRIQNKGTLTKNAQDTVTALEAEQARRKGTKETKPTEAKPAEAPIDPDLAAYEAMAGEQSGMDQDSVDRFAEEIAAIEPMNADKAAKLIKEIKTRKPTREELVALNKYLETLSDEEFVNVYQNGDDNVTINPIIGKAATAIDEIIKDLSAAVGFDLSSLVRFVRGATFKEGPKGGQFNVVGPVILINQRVLDAFNAGNKQVSHGALQHLLTHEFAHVIDHHGNSLSNPDIFHTNSDPAFARDGSLWEQFQKLTNRPAIESFNYPLFNYIGDQTSPEVFANEFFAELTAFVLNEQSFARDHIPEGVQAIEEALSRTAAARQLSRSGTLDTGTTDRGVPESSQTTEEIKPAIKSKGKPKTVAKSLADLKAAIEGQAQETTEPETKPKAKLEPAEQTIPDEETEPESVPLDQAYKDLATSEEGNFFLKSYKRTKKLGSRLMSVASPLVLMRSLLSDKVAHGNALGNTDSFPRNRGIWGEYMDLANQMIDNFKIRFDKIVTSTVDAKGNPKISFLDLMNEGSPVNRYMNLKTMNLLEKVDGVHRFNKQLLESAMLAGMDWLLNIQDRMANEDAEGLGSILGVDATAITDEILSDWNRGIGLSQAKRSLAQHLKRFWDVQDNKDVSETYVQGVAEAMALELITSMEEAGLLKTGLFTAPIGKGLQYGMVYFNTRPDPNRPGRSIRVRDPDTEILMRKLGEERNTISDAALVDKLRTGRSVGEPITEIPQHQLYNPNVLTTNQQKKAAANVQAARHMTNMPMVNFMKFLGLETYVNAMGGAAFDPEKTNVNDAKSKNGVRLGLVSAFNAMLGHVAEVEAYSQRTGIPVSEVPTFFEYALLNLGRLQMRGLFNGQASKLARNVVTPVRAKIDLSQPGSRKFSDFMQAIGQGLGAKPEGKSRREVVVAAMAEINRQRPLIDIMKAHLQDEKQTPATKAEADLFINARMGQDQKASLDDHAFQALLEYARYEVARETGADLTRFESWNFLEADGKTNGPINALMLWAQGQITPRFLQLVAKGGMFFGINDKTLDQHGDKIDLYKAAGNRGSEKVGHLRTAIQNDKSRKVLAQFDAFRRVMSALNVDVVVKGDQIELTRGFAKNRLTITVYGSRENGIAIKAAKELANFIYAAHSEALQAGVEPGDIIYRDQPGQSFDNDLNMLLDGTPDISKDMKYGYKYFIRPVRHSPGTRNPKATRQEYLRDFTLTRTEFDALRDNVQFFLTDPLVEAITEEVMGEIAPVLTAMQKATQIQSIVVRNMFRNKVLAKLADKKIDYETKSGKYPDFHPGDFLSQNELNEIFDSLKQFAAVIDTGTQRYQINSREGTDVFEQAIIEHEGVKYTIQMPESFARSLSGDMKSPIFMNVPRLAGVKVIPYLNIGSGDGQMMLHGMSIDTHRSDISRRTLPVFDGLNMPIDQILEYSRLINESVFKTWTQNSPMRAIAESFRTFAESRPIEQVLEEDPLNTTRDDTIKEMSKIEGGREPDKLIGAQEMNDLIDELLTELDGYADDLESRQQVYRETTQSIDQMASGKGPHNVKGTGSLVLAPGMSDQEIAMVMEGRRLELNAVKAKARGERQAVPIVPASTPVAKLSPAMQAVINLGTEDVTGVRVVQASQLMEVVKHLADIREDQTFVRQLLRAIGLNQKATDQEYRIVFGTPTQLDAWERANNADRFQEGSNDTPKGKIDSVAKIITISNLVPETVIHELLHAATIEKLMAYYGGRAKRGLLSETDQDAIKRIEGLMNEWLLLDFKEADQANASGSQLSQSASLYWINKGIAEGDQNKYMAQAVNEFMAWTLTNQQAKTKARTIKNSAFRIFGAALEAIKNLLFGKSLKVANNLLAQLQFNTRVLISTPTPIELLRTDANSVTMFQSAAFGNNDRLTYFRDRFQQKIMTYLTEGDPNTLAGYTQRYQRSNEIRAARTATRQMVVSFVQHFGDLKKMQAWATFYEMQVGLMTEMQLNPNSLARIQELYDHVIANLEVRDFRENNDPNDQNDLTQAQGKFDAIHGLFVKKTDPYGRSTLMSSFLALAMSSESFRKILSKIDRPKSDKSINPSSRMDQILEDVGNASIDWLSLMTSGERSKDKNVQEALDNLASAMIENVGDQRSVIEQRTEGFVSGADRYFYDNMQTLSGKGITVAENILANSTSKIARAGAKLLHVSSVIINENASTKVAQGFVNALARYDGLHEIRAIANDIVLRTDENAPIYDMIAETKATADQTRQRFREDLPEKLASQFSRPLTDEEWTAQYKVAATDIASLMATHGATGALRMIYDTAHRAAAIRSLEASIQTNEGNRAAKILEKAEQLAFYMQTRKEGPNLLANAYAISKLFGEPGMLIQTSPHADTENSVDELVTLYAIRNLGQETKDTIANLSAENQKNKDGLEFIYHYLVGQRKDELDKAKSTQLSRVNHYKGAMPSEQVGNDSLKIESDTQHARMLKLGYSHVGAYTGSSADQNLSSKSYYYSPTAGLAPYRQGVMQTVHITASGVDPQTGYSVGKLMAGRITNGRSIAQVQRQLRNQNQTNENLRMIYDDGGVVVAIERMADVNKTNTIQRNTNLAEMLGAWRGRQVEEIFAHEINRSLVNELYTIWDNAQRQGRANEFVNVLTATDPVTQNTAKLIPNLMRDHIRSKFGKDTFMVHRSMVLNALGDRQASVADMFTGETRWQTPVQERFEKIAMGIFGNSAFNKLVASERTVQNIITNVKYNIVVKSVVIPMANLTANFGQLLNRGVPLRAILTGVPKKIVEINQYIKSRSQEISLEADLRAARGKNDLNAIRKLEDRLQAMEDSYKRLSIYPLIKAGEFSTISQGNVTAEDLALADGKWSNFMDKMIAMIPDGPLRTTARYGLVTRDTALFQALAKSVQYGDFIAKAILYDDLTNREQVTDEITLARRAFTNKEAIATVNQAFVPYNNLSGRGRHYLESMGLLWFYNYKIRIMKEAVYMLRHHPFRALLMAGIPGLNLIDSPMGSNFLSTLVDGNIGFSVGPEMAYHSWALNPWVNMAR